MLVLHDYPVSFREMARHEELPLALVYHEVRDAIAGRTDIVLFGAHAVNAYCEPDRGTQDVDLMTTDARALAQELRDRIGRKFHAAVRIRVIEEGRSYVVYQLRKGEKNRKLVDVRQEDILPGVVVDGGVQVVEPATLIAMKVASMVERASRPKGMTDAADTYRLLHAFPALKERRGLVEDQLRRLQASDRILDVWRGLVEAPTPIDLEDEDW
jgi:hypothetical protein